MNDLETICAAADAAGLGPRLEQVPPKFSMQWRNAVTSKDAAAVCGRLKAQASDTLMGYVAAPFGRGSGYRIAVFG